MTLWKGADYANNAPLNTVYVDVKKANNTGNNAFHNTTPGAITNGMVVGMYGVTAQQSKAARTDGRAHVVPGWTLVKQGTGPVTGLSASPGGTGYNNTDIVTVSGGQVNATAHPVTNSTGGITSFANLVAGQGFPNTGALTIAVTNSTSGATLGSGATIHATLGGRAGRVTFDTQVAMRSFANTAASNTALFPTV